MFTREELRAFRKRALDLSNDTKSSLWKRAFDRLADATDHLDSMVVREEMRKKNGSEPVIESSSTEEVIEEPKIQEAPNHNSLGNPSHTIMDEDFRE